MKKADRLRGVAIKAMNMLRPSPQSKDEKVQQDRDMVIRSWNLLYDAILKEYPKLSYLKETLKENSIRYKGTDVLGWDLLAYAFAVNVVWEGEMRFMKSYILRYLHIDKDFVEHSTIQIK